MDKKVEIVFGKQPQVVEKVVKVPVRVNPMTRPEAITKCVTSICGVATYGIMVWGIITFFCGNPFRKKVVVVNQQTEKKKPEEEK